MALCAERSDGMEVFMVNKIRHLVIYNTKRLNRDYDNISLEKLEELESKGSIIIDVRSPQEFEEGHIEGAISIPEYELKNRVRNEIVNLEEPIIVYCSTGHRSKRAQELLEQMGYKEVYNLENGWQNY